MDMEADVEMEAAGVGGSAGEPNLSASPTMDGRRAAHDARRDGFA